jgi:hypothetical protein
MVAWLCAPCQILLYIWEAGFADTGNGFIGDP